jgi:hypothetical protein
MSGPGIAPNRVDTEPADNGQHQEILQERPKDGYEVFSNLSYGKILALVFIILVVLLGYVMISNLSSIGGDFGWNVMNWVKYSDLPPSNRGGFENFLKLVLTTGFIALALYFIKKK